jgi:hypothetical protein
MPRQMTASAIDWRTLSPSAYSYRAGTHRRLKAELNTGGLLARICQHTVPGCSEPEREAAQTSIHLLEFRHFELDDRMPEPAKRG